MNNTSLVKILLQISFHTFQIICLSEHFELRWLSHTDTNTEVFDLQKLFLSLFPGRINLAQISAFFSPFILVIFLEIRKEKRIFFKKKTNLGKEADTFLQTILNLIYKVNINSKMYIH